MVGASGRLTAAAGIARSLAVYYGIPWRAAQLRRFYRPLVPEGALCFDVGAHVGNRVRCWRQLGARTVAIEAHPTFAGLLRRWFGRDRGVTVVEMAVGREEGELELLVSDRTPTVSTTSRAWRDSVAHAPRFDGVRWNRSLRVRATTLDALIALHGRPDFVKIDVEGAEPDVLAGLSQAVPALSFEYTPGAVEGALACVARLSALGRYVYNWSEGETLRWGAPAWLDSGAIAAWLGSRPAAARSGDVYARLIAAGPEDRGARP